MTKTLTLLSSLVVCLFVETQKPWMLGLLHCLLFTPFDDFEYHLIYCYSGMFFLLILTFILEHTSNLYHTVPYHYISSTETQFSTFFIPSFSKLSTSPSEIRVSLTYEPYKFVFVPLTHVSLSFPLPTSSTLHSLCPSVCCVRTSLRCKIRCIFPCNKLIMFL